MGATASTNKTSVEQDIVSQSYNSCPAITANNSVAMKNVTFAPNATCKDSNFDITQTAAVDATCLISALQQNTADAVSKLSATAQGGLGFSASTNVSDIKTQLTNKVENDCKSVSASNNADLTNVTITACNFRTIQNANAKSACQINSLQKSAASASTTADATATGLTLASFLTGYNSIIAIAI
ncbi:MAG: hypothetical protein EOP45_16210, partial [Sphingobacteriaceae bacterium]